MVAMAVASVLGAAAMLCKENGVTAIAWCAGYELLLALQVCRVFFLSLF